MHRLRAQSGTECTQMVRNIWTLPGIHKDDEDLRSIEQTSLHVFNVCNVNIKGLINMIKIVNGYSPIYPVISEFSYWKVYIHDLNINFTHTEYWKR